jgi:hypothetical protein
VELWLAVAGWALVFASMTAHLWRTASTVAIGR